MPHLGRESHFWRCMIKTKTFHLLRDVVDCKKIDKLIKRVFKVAGNYAETVLIQSESGDVACILGYDPRTQFILPPYITRKEGFTPLNAEKLIDRANSQEILVSGDLLFVAPSFSLEDDEKFVIFSEGCLMCHSVRDGVFVPVTEETGACAFMLDKVKGMARAKLRNVKILGAA